MIVIYKIMGVDNMNMINSLFLKSKKINFDEDSEETRKEVVRERLKLSEKYNKWIQSSIGCGSEIKYDILIGMRGEQIGSIKLEQVNSNMLLDEVLISHIAHRWQGSGFIKRLGTSIQLVEYKSNMVYYERFFNLEHYILQQIVKVLKILEDYYNFGVQIRVEQIYL